MVSSTRLVSSSENDSRNLHFETINLSTSTNWYPQPYGGERERHVARSVVTWCHVVGFDRTLVVDEHCVSVGEGHRAGLL